jgi:hypothetical protein
MGVAIVLRFEVGIVKVLIAAAAAALAGRPEERQNRWQATSRVN